MQSAPHSPSDQIQALDLRLTALGRGLGAMRLGLGDGLVRLEQVGGFRLLGFPTLGSYAREALGRSGRWAADARALARRLAGLPQLRAALMGGVLSSSKVELVARVATADTDVAWVERAQTMTVRALRAEVATARALDDDEVPARVTITTTVDRVDAWAFERARLMVESVGAARGDESIDALLAEGLTELIARRPGIDLPSALVVDFEGEARISRTEQSIKRAAEEAAREAAWKREAANLMGDPAHRGAARVQGADGARPEPRDGGLATFLDQLELPWPEDVRSIDGRLRSLARELAWRDLELGALALEVDERRLWRELGYASMDHYCRERIGLAPATVASRVALAKRHRRCPEIGGAIADGRIGYEAATLIGRVAGPGTVRAWIGRAEVRTVKLLREEVQAIELVARADGLAVERLGPPNAETLDAVRAIERAVIGSVTGIGDGGPMSGGSVDASPMSGGRVDASPMSASSSGGQVDASPMSAPMSGGGDSGLPKTTLRLTMSEDTARFWRALEALHGEYGDGRSFVGFLVSAAMRSWTAAMPGHVAYGDVYVRDRWRCASPVCSSRNTTPHHIQMRSRGGGEERANLISVCATCHLDLVHQGHLMVDGAAPDGLVWEALGWRA